MKTSQILITVAAFFAGALAIAGIGQLNSKEDSALADTRAELAEVQAELARLRAISDRPLSGIPEDKPLVEEEVITTDAVEEEVVVQNEEPSEPEEPDPAAAIAKLFNSKEARAAIKQFSSGMASRGEQWIDRGIAEYTDKLGLSEAQVASLKTRLSAQMNEQMEEFNKKLDNEDMSMQEIMMQQREVMMGQEDVMAEILKEELTPEQYEDFEREQLVEKTERVQRDSDRELARLDRDLDLTEAQEDQVFGILVQTNSDYDESMGIEGADANVTVDDGVSKEEAIRSVLDDEQAAKYDASNQQREERRRAWGGFGGNGGGGFRGFGR